MRRHRLLYTVTARSDLVAILEWIRRESGVARAGLIGQRFRSRIDGLRDFPKLGRAVPELGPSHHMLTIEPWVVVYRIEADRVLIGRVLDGRRDLPAAIADLTDPTER